MKVYWSAESLPELAHLPVQERREIWREAYANSITSWRTWVSWGLFIVLLSLGIGLGFQLGDSRAYELIKILVAAVLALTIAWPMIMASVRPFIRAELERRNRS